MSASGIEARSEAGVNVIRLARPEKKNALSTAMYRGLSEAFEAGERHPETRVHVLFGSPGVFSAGNDIADFLAHGGGSAGDGLDTVLRFVRLLPMLRKPVVAGVDGLAIGIGTTVLFHCDLVYASRRSIFATPFVDLGLVPEAGSSLLAPQRLGYARAFELLGLGETFSAERMEAAGLVNKVVEETEIESTALAAAQRLAAKPAAALAMSRSLIRGDVTLLGERIEAEVRIFKERLGSPEAQAAFNAFLTKRSGN
ncbi:MAG: crotonase/enoyl-CoA hydratase family protein [Alphaproteobacteria bacterium]|nr:crotonase/enoyl-CoA hydratase family protein [Alphaproteobacteria bacterium]